MSYISCLLSGVINGSQSPQPVLLNSTYKLHATNTHTVQPTQGRQSTFTFANMKNRHTELKYGTTSTLIALQYLQSITIVQKFENIFLWLFIAIGSSSYSPNKRQRRRQKKKRMTGVSRQYRMQSTSSYDLGLKFTYLNWNRESVGSNRKRMNVRR